MKRPTPLAIVELALLALIAVQCARLLWTLVTPLGPVGAWQASPALAAPADDALAGFDPFFRLAGEGGPAAITSLDLKLYGVREDRATGRGSAIIALPNGAQSSYAVGEEIMPGVTLAEVGFDSVTIVRNGVREQIFLDQSTPAETAGTVPPQPAQAAPSAPPPPVGTAPAPPAPRAAGPPIQLQPRVSGGRVTGMIVSPGGDGQAFRAAGFAPGDAIVAVNGQRVTSMEQARALIGRAGGEVTVIVDRDGRAIPMRVRLNP